MLDFLLSVLSNWVADALGASFVVGALLVWLKKHGSPWLIPLCWGLCGSTVILIAAGALRVVATPIPPHVVQITPSNVEDHVKSWIDTFHFSIQHMPDDPSEYFTYSVINRNNRRVGIHRSKAFERYLQFQADVVVSPDDQITMKKLKPVAAVEVVRALVIELSRAKIGSFGIEVPLTHFSLVRSVPIDVLNEAIFAQTIDEMDSGEALAISVFEQELNARTRTP